MKALTGLVLFVWLAYGQPINAQQAPEWTKITPAGERFQVLMPEEPRGEPAEVRYSSKSRPLTATGTAYFSSSADSTYYTLWSLETSRIPSNRVDEISTYLDEYAELVWESLLKPARDALPEGTSPMARMSYKSELSMGVIPGREYTLRLGQSLGTTRLYMDGGRLYVLLALNHGRSSRAATDFFTGFVPKSPSETPFLPGPPIPDADPVVQVFAPSQTTTRARVLSKPEPQYTEEARKYGVTGRVVLRGVISPEGRLTNIEIVRRLPHGLTQASVAAAKQIEFTPAVKDGLAVAQSIQLEYNFNLY